jgi:hypothetical protein
MSPEELLWKFRLHAPADAPRARVLAAVRRARRERRLWRWTWAAAAAVLAVAVPVNVALDSAGDFRPSLRVEREVRQLTRSLGDEAVELRLRLALGTGPGRPFKEMP